MIPTLSSHPAQFSTSLYFLALCFFFFLQLVIWLMVKFTVTLLLVIVLVTYQHRLGNHFLSLES